MMSILIPAGLFLAAYWVRYFLLTNKYGRKLPLILPLAFTCLFIPKITLLQINPDHSMAGIRTDDILSLVMLLVSLRDAYTWKNKKVLIGLGFLLALSVSNFIAIFVGRSMGYDNAIPFSILFILRRFEYFAFVPIGIYQARKTEDAGKVALEEFAIVSVMHVIIGLLQVLGVCNYATMGFLNFVPDYWQGFAISTFNGHYEYGQFLCFAIAIYLCVFIRTKKLPWLGMLLASLVMLWLTHSRTMLIVGAAVMLIILFFSAWRIRRSWLRIAVIAGMVLIIVVGALVVTGVIRVGRFTPIDVNEYAEGWHYYMRTGDLKELNRLVRLDEDVGLGMGWGGDIDGSIGGRFYKWGCAMDGFRQSPIFGYGTGVTQVADGNYFKLIGEGGILGTLLWMGMFIYYMWTMWSMRKRILPARSVFYMMVSVLLACLAFDMFEASKPMEMLYLAIGLVIGLASLHHGAQAPVCDSTDSAGDQTE